MESVPQHNDSLATLFSVEFYKIQGAGRKKSRPDNKKLNTVP